jgi:hypothetical protein
MLTLIHGDNQVASRQQLLTLVERAKQAGRTVTTLIADKLERSTLETALLSTSLFGEEKTIVIEGIFSLPKSKKKDELIELITAADIEIILWEKKSLGKLDQKKLPNTCEVFEYKVTVKLWTFLDQLQPKTSRQQQLLELLHESIAHESAEFVLLMLARQIRLLIQAKENAPNLKLAPFMLTKLRKQAQAFSLPELLNLHQQLYRIDQHQKQSTNLLSLEAQLDLLLINL